LVQQHNLALVEKTTPMAIEVINGQNYSSRLVMHEIKVLMVIIGSYNIKVVFQCHLISDKPYHHWVIVAHFA
jgi:hypothetical protein